VFISGRTQPARTTDTARFLAHPFFSLLFRLAIYISPILTHLRLHTHVNSDVLSGATDVFAVLAAMSASELRARQAAIAAIASTLQYSLVPARVRAAVNVSAQPGASSGE